MRIAELVPDVAPEAPAIAPIPASSAPSSGASGSAFGDLVSAADAVLAKADVAEAQFAAHRGGLQEMVVERARADIALQIAAAGAQRVTQGLQTLLGMQI
jgi:flagellar hook-basal body complex protein FliE